MNRVYLMRLAVADALRDLRLHPGRSVLSGITLTVGVLAVIAMSVLSTVANEVMVAAEEQRSGRAVTLSAPVPSGALGGQELVQVGSLLDAVIRDQGGEWAVVCTAPEAGVIIPTDHAVVGAGPDLEINLVAGRLPGVRRLPVISGRWLRDDPQALPPEAVLNTAAAARFGQVGDIVRLTLVAEQPAVPVRIVGEVADGSPTPTIYSGLSSALALRPMVQDNCHAGLLFHHPTAGEAQLTAVADGAIQLARLPDMPAPSRLDGVDSLGDQLSRMRVVLGIAALVALGLAALGILNIGLSSVSARSKELVIRRAVGARRFDLFGLVVLNAVVIGVLGAAAATGVAWALMEWVLPDYIPAASAIEVPVLPVSGVALGIAAGGLATVVGSLVPALMAARAEVGHVLRD